MPRKGKGTKATKFKAATFSKGECAVCGYPKSWKVHNHA